MKRIYINIMVLTLKILMIHLFIASILTSCGQSNIKYPIIAEADSKFDQSQQWVSDSLINLTILDDSDLVKIKIPSDLTPIENYIEAVKVFESVRYVSLETSKENQIFGIENSIVYQDKIFILDNLGKSVLVFNVDGKFIRKIGAKGEGPEKFVNPICMDIDKRNQNLYIFDDKQSKFLVFDLEGNFVEEKQVNFRLNDFKIFDDGSFIINIDTKFNAHLPGVAGNKLIYTDDKFEVLAKGYEYDAVNAAELRFSRRGLYSYADETLYNPTFSYQIFSLNATGLKPKYLIDAGSAMLPKNFDYKLSSDEFDRKYDDLNSSFMYIDGPIIETDDYLLTALRYRIQNGYLFYSKKSQKVFCSLHFKHEPYKMSIYAPIRGESNSQEFYGYIDAGTFKQQANFILENKVGEIDAELLAISENDNPIFIFYTLKEF